jgi:hypothetical protein
MLQRLKKIIKLSTKDLSKVDALSDEQIDAIPDEGDGKAVYFGEGTEEELLEQEREDKGLKGIFGIGL